MLGHFKMDLKAKAEQYFKTFSSKDLNGLASMFADNIMLRDWTGDATGKEKVLTANQDIFDAVDTIQVKPLTLYQAEASLEDNTVIAEIEIEVNGDEKLMVRVYNATGGMIIETSRWNPTAGEWETEMTVIHNDSTEQVTNDIAKIITLESLKK